MKNIGEKFKEFRKKNNFSQIEFAKKLNITNVSLSRIEKNKEQPGRNLIEKLISLGADPVWIFDDGSAFGNYIKSINERKKENPLLEKLIETAQDLSDSDILFLIQTAEHLKTKAINNQINK